MNRKKIGTPVRKKSSLCPRVSSKPPQDTAKKLREFYRNICEAPEWRAVSATEFLQRSEAVLANRLRSTPKAIRDDETFSLAILLLNFIEHSYELEFQHARLDKIRNKRKLAKAMKEVDLRVKQSSRNN